MEGNLIGTDNDGSGRLGNATGVTVSSAASGNVIGGTDAGAGNVISGNMLFGVVLADAGTTGNLIEGNLIGTDKDGAGVLYNITGVLIGSGASANVIGGTAAEARNVISGNKLFGVLITDTGTTGNLVQGNSIGTAKDGASPLGNGSAGVSMDADDNAVGGTVSGAGNTIAHNAGAGVVVLGSGDAVRGNSIYSNAALGIDLGGDGVTPNDAGDGDAGGNRLQNFPVLTGASGSPSSTTVVGTLDSTQFTVFTIEFFGSSAADPSGFGQGQQFVGSTTVTTDGAGHASFTATFPIGLAAGAMVTATATDPGGNTSEFSRAIAQSLGVAIDDVTQDEGNGLVTGFTFTVSLSQATNQPVSVDFATLDGSATAGSDYTAANGTLTFAAGETSQTITVLVTGDTTSEADESFFVALSNASQGFIADNLGVGIIANDDGALSISDVSKAEGNTGLTPFTFTVTLANASTRTVKVNYATADGSATVAGGDFVAASGALTFNPGDVSKTVTISVKGDTVPEPDETFLVKLSGASNAAIARDQGVGTIKNDDVDAGSLQFAQTAFSVARDGGSITITVNRTGGAASGVTVDFATSDGTAKAGIDYTATAGTLVFGAGDTSATFAIAILNDMLVTGEKTLNVSLSNPTGGAALAGSGSGGPSVSLVSVNRAGNLSTSQTGSVQGHSAVVSANGRFVAFESDASDLVANDTNHTEDVFVRDLQLGTTTLVSVNNAGTGSGNSFSTGPRISADGRFVVFASSATDLVPGFSPGGGLFVRDLQMGSTELVVANDVGLAPGDASFEGYDLSANGRYVAFESSAGNLVANDFNNDADIFVRDLVAHTNTLVTVSRDGASSTSYPDTFNEFHNFAPVLSADGRFVAFYSTASDLSATADNNGVPDVFVRDLQLGVTTLVSVNQDGTAAGNDGGVSPAISADGKVVTFNSDSTDLVANQRVPIDNLFVRNLVSRSTTLVSVNATGTAGGNNGSEAVFDALQFETGSDLSADGRFVVFNSNSSDLLASDAVYTGIVGTYVRDVSGGTTTLIALGKPVPAPGLGSVDSVGVPYISGDGRFVTFASFARDLVADDNDNTIDAFVRDRLAGTTTLLSAGNVTYNGNSSAPVPSADGRTIVFESTAGHPLDHGNVTDVYAAPLAQGSAAVTIGDASGRLQFGQPAFSVAKGSGSITITVTRAGGSAGGVTVDYATGDGTARAGIDYTAAAGTLTFGAGETSRSFTVPLLNDGLLTGDKTVILTLGNPTGGATLGGQAAGASLSLVSVNSAGTGSGNGTSPFSADELPAVSANGRYVAFGSSASDLVANDNNGTGDIFLRDLKLGTTTLVSVNSASTGTVHSFALRLSALASVSSLESDSGNGLSLDPSISADGRYVVFESYATDLVPGFGSGQYVDLYVRDMQAGTTEPVNVDTGRSDDLLLGYQLSADGRSVAFETANSALMQDDIFVRDLAAHTTSLVSVSSDGHSRGNNSSTYPVISADGRFVAFQSEARNLIPGFVDGNDLAEEDVYLRDLQLGTTTLVSMNLDGTASGNNASRPLAFSANGQFLAFDSDASDLAANDANGLDDLFVRDLVHGTTALASVNLAGTGSGNGKLLFSEGDINSIRLPILSADGRFVVFESQADDLVANDTNGARDVFVRDLAGGTTTLVSVARTGTGSGNGTSTVGGISADGRFVTFDSLASDLVANDTNGTRDVFVRDLRAGTTTLLSANSANGGAGDQSSDDALPSSDGTTFIFFSSAANLLAIDQNNKGDIFAAHPQSASTAVLTIVAPRSAPPPTTTPTTTRTTILANSPSAGVIAVVATVSGTANHILLTGTVTLLEGNSALQTIPVDATGHAAFVTSTLGPGNHALIAVYSGDLNYAGSTSSVFNMVIANNLPGPTVTLLQRYGFHSQPTTLVLTFSQALDDARAENVSNYRIVPLGRLRSHHGRAITIRAAVYDPVSHTLTLWLATRLNIHRTYQLTVSGSASSGIISTTATPLGALGQGEPGVSYVADINGRRLAGSEFARRSRFHTPRPKGPSAHAFDALAASGQLKRAAMLTR